jgi:hypothetical protein
MQPYSLPHKQQGAVLLIGMIMLVILMLGATSLMNGTVMDERLAGNSKASAEAFFAAEAGYITAVNHLNPKKVDEPTEIDTAKANKHWATLYGEINKYETPAQWKNRSKKPELPAELKSYNGKHAFEINIEPVFENEKDEYGNNVPKRVPGRIKFVSEGKYFAADGERLLATRTIGFDLEAGGGNVPPAPAAISCFGGPCKLNIGAASNGNNSSVNGRNHTCTPDGCEDYPVISGDDAFSVPSVFLTDSGNSEIGIQGSKGNGKKEPPKPFIGQDKDDKESYTAVSGKALNGDASGSIWIDNDFPSDEKPTNEKYIGENEDSLVNQALKVAGSDIGNLETPLVTLVDPANKQLDEKSGAGVLIIDRAGQEYKAAGGGYFVGLVILRGCTQWTQRGAFTIYGAMIIDTTGCDDTYYPFDSRGGPDIKYSQDALDSASNAIGAGVNGLKVDWYEIVNND